MGISSEEGKLYTPTPESRILLLVDTCHGSHSPSCGNEGEWRALRSTDLAAPQCDHGDRFHVKCHDTESYLKAKFKLRNGLLGAHI